MDGLYGAALNALLFLEATSSSNTRGAQKGMLRTYFEAVNYLFPINATESDIAETDDALLPFNETSIMSPPQCAEALVVKLLRCGEVYHEFVLTGSITEDV